MISFHSFFNQYNSGNYRLSGHQPLPRPDYSIAVSTHVIYDSWPHSVHDHESYRPSLPVLIFIKESSACAFSFIFMFLTKCPFFCLAPNYWFFGCIFLNNMRGLSEAMISLRLPRVFSRDITCKKLNELLGSYARAWKQFGFDKRVWLWWCCSATSTSTAYLFHRFDFTQSITR